MIVTKDLSLIFMPILGIPFLFFCTIIVYVKYIFTDDLIIIKYPFMAGKKYFIKDIIGFDSNRVKSESWFIIYFDNKKIKMEVSGKRFKEKVKNFSEKYYNIICEKNIERIKSSGFEVILSKTKLVFFDNRMEIFGKKDGVYSLWGLIPRRSAAVRIDNTDNKMVVDPTV
jgi:hypothetical protein